MLIAPAYAQAGDGGGLFGGGIAGILPLILIFAVFYFLLIRPQQKKMKQHREMVASLKRGDRIVTGGGIVGRVARVEGNNEIIVEIAPEVRVRMRQGTVAEVVVRSGAPASDEARQPAEKIAPEKAASSPDYYSILGVKKSADANRISKAYQKFEAQFESGSDDPQAQEKLDVVNEAYETLKDPKLRKIYDSLGHDEYMKIQGS
jgi:preprotein translocase subunit YajC